jgi:hypothetical protein
VVPVYHWYGPSSQTDDDNPDDNLDDNCALNNHRYTAESSLSCLVTASACSWQCGGTGSSGV